VAGGVEGQGVGRSGQVEIPFHGAIRLVGDQLAAIGIERAHDFRRAVAVEVGVLLVEGAGRQ
jgi:hypothetical protein